MLYTSQRNKRLRLSSLLRAQQINLVCLYACRRVFPWWKFGCQGEFSTVLGNETSVMASFGKKWCSVIEMPNLWWVSNSINILSVGEIFTDRSFLACETSNKPCFFVQKKIWPSHIWFIGCEQWGRQRQLYLFTENRWTSFPSWKHFSGGVHSKCGYWLSG